MNTTIAIPTCRRPQWIGQAVASAEAQTAPCEVVVVDAGGASGVGMPLPTDPGPYVHWYLTAAVARGPLVNLLHDDDWLEPEFVARCEALFAGDVAYVFTQAAIAFQEGGRRELNLPGMPAEAGHIPAPHMAELLLGMPYTVSPCCVLFRRDDLLRDLGDLLRLSYRGELFRPRVAGYDKLLVLLPLLRYARVGWVGAPSANFRHWAGSDTVASQASPERNKALLEDYRDAGDYFRRVRGC